MKLFAVLLALFVVTVFAAEESCYLRCQNGFDPLKKCQCDAMCKYYGSCCADFDTTCRNKVARGDTFEAPEEIFNGTLSPENAVTTVEPSTTTLPPTTLPPTTIDPDFTLPPTTDPPTTTTHAPTPPPDPDAVPCSGRTFDAFMESKNGSLYAFRGDYFFELDDRAVKPGYPKLIKDVWGISGPIDAAFTRINCQGKTYIFKGNKYWRFDGDVLDDDYPRDISVGFVKIPSDVDAAFSIPAPGHKGKEKVYFFKGDQYYQYEFQHQPTHEECVQMTKASPSRLFTQYTDTYCLNPWDELLELLFQGYEGHKKGPRFISKDWHGIKAPVDAAMLGRLYVMPKPTDAPSAAGSRKRSRGRGRNKARKSRSSARQARSLFWEDYGLDYEERYFGATDKKKDRGRRPSLSLWDYLYEPTDPVEITDIEVEVHDNPMPAQNVYFFKKDKYYRMDLQTKRIDYVNPPYPRNIAKYWMGCKDTDADKAEK
ncbi:vitronectin b [Engraulis encrasicolus]|uniref:vitronectin b n=1 Tax=Engraulis encrasicolus TaxID=184585 RepID=UPI002FD115F2